MPCEEIEVTLFPLDDDRVLPVERLGTWLTGAELERAAAFRFPVHQHRYLRGRAMVRWLLARRLGLRESALVFEVADKGKPYLAEGDLHFNLSHSEGMAVCAVSSLPSIGIDIECFSRKVNIDGLSARCFRDNERASIASRSGEEKKKAFFWYWTAKEARMKATGEGFSLDPTRIEVECRGLLPSACRTDGAQDAYLAAVEFPGHEVACTVAALAPFDVRINERLPEFAD